MELKLLEVQNLNKCFIDSVKNTIEILNNVNFTFNENPSVAIVGASGSGKSTFLHILGGLEKPTSGQVLFNKNDIYSQTQKNLSQWRNQEIGFVFQFHHLLLDFTALENVMLPALIAGESKKNSEEQAMKLLQEVQVDHRQTHKPSQLSGGEQQRVAIARALINRPSYILADEPTGNLDRKNSEIISNLLIQVCHEFGTKLIMVTHDMELAAKLDLILEITNLNFTPYQP